jgi:2-hydroxychromene-2-carboxylate isomerase
MRSVPPGQIEFWYEFASTYSYLSAMRIEDLAAQAGVQVIWRPFLLGPIFAAQGWTSSPFNLYPAKGAYMWRDMERLCTARGLPFQRPDPFPQNGLLAARLVLAAPSDQRPALTRAIYHAQFAQGAQISDPSALRACLGTCGLSPDLLDATTQPDVKSDLRANSELSIQENLFGAPSFRAGSELFWGDDRLAQALDWAKPD